MTKTEFLRRLAKLLRGMDPDERAQWLADYSEMIDDRMEEGLNEAQAVAAMDTVEAVARQIRTEAGLPDVPKILTLSRRKVLILVCTSPLWIPAVLTGCAVALTLALSVAVVVLAVAIGLLAVALSLVASLGAVVIGLYAAVAGLAAGGVGCVLGGTIMTCTGHFLSGLFTVGTGLLAAGLVIPMAAGVQLTGKSFVRLCRMLCRCIRTAVQRLTHRKECAA